MPSVLAFLDRRRENGPAHFAAESGRLPETLRGGGQWLVGDVQIDFLIRRIVGEFPPVRLPPRLPALRLSQVDAALQDLPPWIFAETHVEQLGVIKILPAQAVQRAEDLPHRSSPREVQPSRSFVQVVLL